MAISHWDKSIDCCVQLAQYFDQFRSCNVTLRISPPVYSLALCFKKTEVPVLTHESIGCAKMDINHWEAAIHCGIQLSNVVIESDVVKLKDLLQILYGYRPLCTLLPWDSKVTVWIHGSIGYSKMDISHWDADIHYGVQLVQYHYQTRYCNTSLWISPLVYSLALRHRNTKVPVWTRESIGYSKIDINNWDVAIHFGVQVAQYCDQTRSCNATLWILPLCTSLT